MPQPPHSLSRAARLLSPISRAAVASGLCALAGLSAQTPAPSSALRSTLPYIQPAMFDAEKSKGGGSLRAKCGSFHAKELSQGRWGLTQSLAFCVQRQKLAAHC